MAVSFSSSPLMKDSNALSAYQAFTAKNSSPDHEVVFQISENSNGKTVEGASTKNLFQRLYRFLFGQGKSSIAHDFEGALKEKYGTEIANFAFSSDKKNKALSQGLNKATIKEVIDNAERLKKIVILQEAAPNAEILGRIVKLRHKFTEEIKKSIVCPEKLENFVQEINSLDQAIKDSHATKQAPPVDSATVKKQLEEYLLSHGITSLSNEAPMSSEVMLATLAYYKTNHENVLNELETRIRNNPKELGDEIQQAVEAVTTTLIDLSEPLRSFSVSPERPDHDFFLLTEQKAVSLQSHEGSPQPTRTENEHVWDHFLKVLENYYGKPLLENLLSPEERKELRFSPLTVSRSKLLLEGCQHLLHRELALLRREPLFVTEEFIEILRSNPTLLTETLQSQTALPDPQNSSPQLTRSLINIGILAVATHVGLAIPIIPLALGVSALSGAVAGIITTRREDGSIDPSTATRAAGYSGTLVAGSTGGQFIGEAVGGYLSVTLLGPLGETLTPLIAYGFNTGGSYLAEALHTAFIGGAVSGAQHEGSASAENSSTQTFSDIAHETSLEGNLLDVARTVIQGLCQAAGRIPIDHQAKSSFHRGI